MSRVTLSDREGARWIKFEEYENAGAKTKRWHVWPADEKTRHLARALGFIRWYGAWRKYAFVPNTETIFEATCLRDIADFCERQTREHRDTLKARKAMRRMQDDMAVTHAYGVMAWGQRFEAAVRKKEA